MFRIIVVAVALTPLAVSRSSATEPFLAEIRIFAGTSKSSAGGDQASCTVASVGSALRPGEKTIAGPFRSREEALKAMKEIPECTTGN